MKNNLDKKIYEKGEIGTIIVLSVLVIFAVITTTSSLFLSQKQTTSTKAAGTKQCPDGDCLTTKTKPTNPPAPTQKPTRGFFISITPIPTTVPRPSALPTIANTVSGSIHTPTPEVKDECKPNETSNQGCNMPKCEGQSRQCTCNRDVKTGALKWSCQCIPDANCQLQPTQSQGNTQTPQGTGGEQSGTATGTNNETGGNKPLDYCPDGGMRYSDGTSCDYGRQTAGNSVYIDKDNPNECAGCTWVKYGGSFPYGSCKYANSDVCRRADNIGGCAGLCNSACCTGKPLGEGGSGESYDKNNKPGTSGLSSSDVSSGGNGGGFTGDSGVNQGNSTVTMNSDSTIEGTRECITDIEGFENQYWVIDSVGNAYPTGESC